MGSYDKFGIGKVGVKHAKAVVAITARLIDVNTGEILASESGKGESKRSGTSLLGGGAGNGGGGGGGVDMSSSNFAQTIIGEAVNDAVTELGGKLDADSAKIAHTQVQVSGVVADATGSDIVINIGSKNGVHVGDKLNVNHVGRVIKDPVTGKPLRSIDTMIGVLTITSVDEGSAVGTFVGTGTAKVGDTVKTSCRAIILKLLTSPCGGVSRPGLRLVSPVAAAVIAKCDHQQNERKTSPAMQNSFVNCG